MLKKCVLHVIELIRWDQNKGNKKIYFPDLASIPECSRLGSILLCEGKWLLPKMYFAIHFLLLKISGNFPPLGLCTRSLVGLTSGNLTLSGAGSTEKSDRTAANPAKDCMRPSRVPAVYKKFRSPL